MPREFVPGSVDYDRQSAVFASGRALSESAETAWREAVQRHVRRRPGMRVLDLGSGTGRFSGRLAAWLDANVLAVEPSEGMRRKAAAAGPDARVAMVAGTAEAIPLADASCDAAWMHNVIHHVRDRAAAAQELGRVLRPDATVLMGGGFPDRGYEILFFHYFPGAQRICDQFPASQEIAQHFAPAGFRLETVDRVRFISVGSLAEMAARTRLRADTTLELLSDAEFAAGQAALERAAAAESKPRPVTDALDLLVFRCGGG